MTLTTDDEAFRTTLARLSKLSVERHFDAYADVDWDAPEMQVEHGDLRWAPMAGDPVAETDWFRGLTPEQQARYCLARIVSSMRIGWQFENLLQRGLLIRAFRMGNGSPEFRYVHHEIIEESQHTLMFQEVADRAGLPIKGMPWWARAAGVVIVSITARWAPAAFFFLVLGGEEPVDHVQRRTLREGHPHPLIERIMRIHVTEEARHVSFARHTLRREVPALHPVRRASLSITVPVVMAAMSRLMLAPNPEVREHGGLPREVAREAARSAPALRLFADSVANIRELCEELGMMSRPAKAVWRALGLGG